MIRFYSGHATSRLLELEAGDHHGIGFGCSKIARKYGSVRVVKANFDLAFGTSDLLGFVLLVSVSNRS